MSNDFFWQTKLHARLHDPAEKALVLLRDPAGHEGGASRALPRLLGHEIIGDDWLAPDHDGVLDRVLFKDGIPRAMYETVRRADHWAAAADRPQWPLQPVTTASGRTCKTADWARVQWSKQPVLIHPLTGQQYDLAGSGNLKDTDLADIKQRSFAHFSGLLNALEARGSERDWRKILLTFWRFGPEAREEAGAGKLGELWRLLPADTRVPDHSIWDHLDLVSGFAGAFATDPAGEAALLSMSLGPVQRFIEAARTTSDLWAGSHLLSRLSWEMMKPICEELGPDAILFPRLRGVPQVDVWLRDVCGLPGKLFGDAAWTQGGTDSNPLFSAALPNRLVAIVPRSRAADIARSATARVREWLQNLGNEVVDRLLAVAGLADGAEQYCHGQMRDQLAGFPEVHWAAVPFSLIGGSTSRDSGSLDPSALAAAMAPFFGAGAGQPCGFLDSSAWKVLQKRITLEGNVAFYEPNPGVLYPAVYDLAERVAAAAKSARTFEQLPQQGWRCSLTGESEWLTTDPNQLQTSYRNRKDTLWARIAGRRPAWAKKGEHLGALAAIKRLWPTLFAEEVGRATGENIDRFVVSTHTMALVTQLDHWLAAGARTTEGWRELMRRYSPGRVALPARLARDYRGKAEALERAKDLAGLLDVASELTEDEAAAIEREARKVLALGSGNDARDIRLEAYYGMLLLDGDKMGAWLSGEGSEGGRERFGISYLESFHPEVRAGFEQLAKTQPLLRAYGHHIRALSPNRHLAISGALNDFSLSLVRHVVEREYPGRVIYAGGDDVLAMLPVSHLLSVMQRLRRTYSGDDPARNGSGRGESALRLGNGFARLDGKLMRTMGKDATASCGAIVAHHQAPLGMVLRELRAAEKRAKNEGRRDAFSLTVIKRSGGALQLTAKWGEPVDLLLAMRNFLADAQVSRRAVYHSVEWLNDLPPLEGTGEEFSALLAYQFARQAERPARERHAPAGLASRLVALALGQPETTRTDWIRNFLSVAEFLARETRVETTPEKFAIPQEAGK